MNNIFILGEHSFIAKHLYLKIKQTNKFNVILLNHHNYTHIKTAQNNDVIINFCGINRAQTEKDYQEANHFFLQKVLNNLTNTPFFIHISSLMVYGFENKQLDELNDYQRWFINSKLNGETYLRENYKSNNMCVIRPSSIYGYDCTPYYNNLLSSLVYEKLNKLTKITNININCVRNILSVDNFIVELYDIIVNKPHGIYNIISTNEVNLKTIVNYIYDNNTPNYIHLLEGENDKFNRINTVLNDDIKNIVVKEDLSSQILKLEQEMKQFLELKQKITINKLNVLEQPRGNMIEISNLQFKRLYKITLNQHSVRGNHYHYHQIEQFYTNKDKVVYLFCGVDNINVVYFHISNENEIIIVNPYVVHTLSNDFMNNNPEIIISSTQEFIKGEIPDTKYINII